MSVQTDTKPKVGGGNGTAPKAHLVDLTMGEPRKGDFAICGARLKGERITPRHVVCSKCLEIKERRAL